MKDLLTQFSIQEILIFLVLFATAFKTVVTFWDWLINWIKIKFDKNNSCEKTKKEITDKVTINYNMIANQEERLNKMSKALDILIASDKDDIKSWITEKHHYFCYELGYIDDYNYQCIEARYAHYKEEDGNTFIDAFMDDIRALPKVSVIDNKNNKQ